MVKHIQIHFWTPDDEKHATPSKHEAQARAYAKAGIDPAKAKRRWS